MVPRILIGSVLAGFLMFAWGGVWNTVLPFGRNVIRPLKARDPMIGVIVAQRLGPGAYQFPYDPGPDATEEQRQAYIAAHEEGPVGMLFVGKDQTPMSAETLLAGLVHIVLVALLLAIALAMALPALPGYGMRVLFCTVVMSVGAAFINFGYPIFFYMDGAYWMAAFFFDVISGMLAGLVLGKVLPKSASAPA